MNLLVWLVLVASVNSTPAPEARRSRQTSRSSRDNRRELSDDDILRALTILLGEAEEAEDLNKGREREDRKKEGREKTKSERLRERAGRQGFQAANGDCETTGFEVRNREECNEVTEIKCEFVNITKFRNTIVERCQTLFDQKCNVTFNDIPKRKCLPKQRNKCYTEYKIVEDKVYKEECKVDVQHVCEELIPVEVPYPVKKPYQKPPEPYPDKVLPKQPFPPDRYADFIPLPHDAHPTLPPDLHAQPSEQSGQYEPPQHQAFHPTVPPGPIPHPTKHPTFFRSELETAESHHHSSPSYSYDPTPGPSLQVSPTPDIFRSSRFQTTHEQDSSNNKFQSSQLAFALFNKPSLRLSRKKRNFVFPGSPNGPPGMARHKSFGNDEKYMKELLLKEIVKQLLVDVIEKNQALGSVNATIKKQRSIDPISYQFYLDSETPYVSQSSHQQAEPRITLSEGLVQPHNPLLDIPKDLLHNLRTKPNDKALQELYDDLKKNSSHAINQHSQLHHHPGPNHDIHHLDSHKDTYHDLPHDLHHHTPVSPHPHLPHGPHHHLPHSPHAHPPHGPVYPPTITTHELPAPPGCRSIAIKECHKIPVIVPKKVPYEACTTVPDIDCVTTLKSVPELECIPEVLRECSDVEKKVPYLVPEEECVEVAFDECVMIEEKVPVELCKRKRLNEESITLSKGEVVRKEGEKRRRPIGRRAHGSSKRKSSTSKQTSSSSKQTSSSSKQTSSSSK